MTTEMNNRPLASIISEFFGEDETRTVILCDVGNGSAWGEAGRATDYDAEVMSNLTMTDIADGEDRISSDGFESLTQSAWQDGENGYRWRVRF